LIKQELFEVIRVYYIKLALSYVTQSAFKATHFNFSLGILKIAEIKFNPVCSISGQELAYRIYTLISFLNQGRVNLTLKIRLIWILSQPLNHFLKCQVEYAFIRLKILRINIAMVIPASCFRVYHYDVICDC